MDFRESGLLRLGQAVEGGEQLGVHFLLANVVFCGQPKTVIIQGRQQDVGLFEFKLELALPGAGHIQALGPFEQVLRIAALVLVQVLDPFARFFFGHLSPPATFGGIPDRSGFAVQVLGLDLIVGNDLAEVVREDAAFEAVERQSESIAADLCHAHKSGLFDRDREPVGLDLLMIKLGLLPAFGGDDALAESMDFQHVFGGFFLVEAEDFHKHEHNVTHEVDRVVPHNHVPVLLESLFNLFLGDLHRNRQSFSGHNRASVERSSRAI